MPGAYGYADPLFLLLAALALEVYLGRLGWFGGLLSRPRAAVVRLARALERRLNRPERSLAARRLRGWLVTIFLLVAAGTAGWLLALFTRFYPFAWSLELLLLILLLRQRRTWQEAAAVTAALGRGDLQTARASLLRLAAGDITPLQAERLDAPAVLPAALTALGRRLADSLISPVLWYVLLGPGGLAVQQVSLLLARLYGGVALYEPGRAPEAGAFGEAALRLARAVEWLPSRLAGLLLALALRLLPAWRSGDESALRRPWGRRPETILAALAQALPATAALPAGLSLFTQACLLHGGALLCLLLLRLLLAG
ncbi:cobalamin biosynthesis protein [Aquibaculum sediminis]|uniref:cobalamin biosynthesis protein n=1 Tax=Aquibaculum sediminis TaxID=3231907 RepID=UPI0034557984